MDFPIQSKRSVLLLLCAAASISLSWFGLGQASTGAEKVVYYNQSVGFRTENLFSFKVLKLALAKSGKNYVLKPSPLGPLTELRATQAMIAGEKIDVQVLGATAAIDKNLWAVQFPIDRGLLGYRIFLIDGARQAEFSRIKSLADLKKMSALQGRGWPDNRVMRHAGLPVWTGTKDSLTRMIMAGRADYYPRGAYEVFGEQKVNRLSAPGLEVEKSLVLRYKFSMLFHVHRKNTELHDDIYRGVIKAYNDGSYSDLFNNDSGIQNAIVLTKIGSRRVIDIENPYLPPETLAIEQKYWYRP